MSKPHAFDRILEELMIIAPAGYAIGLHIRFAAPLMTFFTYPDAWLQRYTKQGYGLRDPIIGWGLSTTGSTHWSDIKVPDPFNILAEAADYGLRFGSVVSLGPITSRTIAGYARSDRPHSDAEIARLSDLTLRLHDLSEPATSLTSAQTEALKLIADGYRHTAASQKLGISESALKARLNSARSRLLARTTAEAIQRAKEYRLL